jgi:lipopolysaccharide export system protein LptC
MYSQLDVRMIVLALILLYFIYFAFNQQNETVNEGYKNPDISGNKYDTYKGTDGLNFDIANYKNYKKLNKEDFAKV